MSDPINPSHYKHLPAEAIDIIEAAIEGAPSPQAAAAQSHLLGYALRANQKGQLAIDAGKAEWYAARWIKAIREAEAKAIPANETPSEPPKRFYRDPTLEDLKNRPIDCEVRDCDIQAWRKATLQSIYPGAAYEFQVKKHGSLRENRYAQCRIEVTE